MINYFGKFLPNLYENTENLKILQKRTQSCALVKIIKKKYKLQLLVIRPPMLKIYNLLLPIKLSCGSSEKGLGSVLEQKKNECWHPIVNASRSLNKSEQNYCQLQNRFCQLSLLELNFLIISMVNLFMCTVTIFDSNQYLPSLLSDHPHTFKDFLSVYKSITVNFFIGIHSMQG